MKTFAIRGAKGGAHSHSIRLLIQLTIKLKKLIGCCNFKQLSKLISLEVKPIGFFKPVIPEGFVDQDVDSLIQRHIGEESCNIIRDQNIIFINKKVSNFISKIKSIGNCVLVYGKWFQLFFEPLGELVIVRSGGR